MKFVLSWLAISRLSASFDDASLLQLGKLTSSKLTQLDSPCGNSAICTGSGDPHFDTFDGANANCFGPISDYYMMKTDQLQVQYRARGRPLKDCKGKTPTEIAACTPGYAVIDSLVISGKLLGGHVISIPGFSAEIHTKFFNSTKEEQDKQIVAEVFGPKWTREISRIPFKVWREKFCTGAYEQCSQQKWEKEFGAGKKTQFPTFSITHGKGACAVGLKKAIDPDSANFKSCGSSCCNPSTYTVAIGDTGQAGATVSARVVINENDILAVGIEVLNKDLVSTDGAITGHCGNWNCNKNDDAVDVYQCRDEVPKVDGAIVPLLHSPMQTLPQSVTFSPMSFILGPNLQEGRAVRKPECDAADALRWEDYCEAKLKSGSSKDITTCLNNCCTNPETCKIDGLFDVPGMCNLQMAKVFEKICTDDLDGKDDKQPVKAEDVHDCKVDCCLDRALCPDRDAEGRLMHCLVWGDPHIKPFDHKGSDIDAFFKHGDYWLVNEKDGPLQIQGRYASNRRHEGKRASLEGVAITGWLLGSSPGPSGSLKFPKIEIPPSTATDFLQVLVDGKKVTSDVTTPQYAIKFGRVPSVQHYEGEKYFLDNETKGVIQNPDWQNYDNNGVSVTLFAMGDEVAKIVVNQGPVQDLLIVISSWLADPDGGLTTGLSGHCGGGTFAAEKYTVPDPNNLPNWVEPSDSLFSWKHESLGLTNPEGTCPKDRPRLGDDETACSEWFVDHSALEHDGFSMDNFEDDVNECVQDCCNNFYDAKNKVDRERPYDAKDYHYLDSPCEIPFGPLWGANDWIAELKNMADDAERAKRLKFIATSVIEDIADILKVAATSEAVAIALQQPLTTIATTTTTTAVWDGPFVYQDLGLGKCALGLATGPEPKFVWADLSASGGNCAGLCGGDMKCFGYSKSFTQQCVLYYQKELVVAAKVDPQNFETTKWREWGNCNCFVKRVPPPTTTTTTKTVPRIEAMVVMTTTTTTTTMSYMRRVLTHGNVIALNGGHSRKWCSDDGWWRVRCNRDWIKSWEMYTVFDASQFGAGKIALKGGNTGKMCADEFAGVVCNRDWILQWEAFTPENLGQNMIALKGGQNGMYCADEFHRLVCNRQVRSTWETFELSLVR